MCVINAYTFIKYEALCGQRFISLHPYICTAAKIIYTYCKRIRKCKNIKTHSIIGVHFASVK